eukprot:6175179-Pleurochrysis_carterae.AAC.2
MALRARTRGPLRACWRASRALALHVPAIKRSSPPLATRQTDCGLHLLHILMRASATSARTQAPCRVHATCSSTPSEARVPATVASLIVIWGASSHPHGQNCAF